MERILILIADKHPQVRAQIVGRLEREPDFDIVALADSSASAIAGAKATHPRLILIDPKMEEGVGLETIRHLRADVPNAVVVVLSAFTDTAQRIELGKLGVRFILNKGIDSLNLVAVLHQAASGF